MKIRKHSHGPWHHSLSLFSLLFPPPPIFGLDSPSLLELLISSKKYVLTDTQLKYLPRALLRKLVVTGLHIASFQRSFTSLGVIPIACARAVGGRLSPAAEGNAEASTPSLCTQVGLPGGGDSHPNIQLYPPASQLPDLLGVLQQLPQCLRRALQAQQAQQVPVLLRGMPAAPEDD